MKTHAAAALAVFALATAGEAKAAPSVDTSSLHLQGARSAGGMLLPSAWVLERGGWDLALTYGHEEGVLRAKVPTENVRGGARTREVSWLDSRDLAYLQLALSPLERLELMAALPMLLGQTVGSEAGLEPPKSGSTAFGDLRLGLRYGLFGSAEGGWAASLQGALFVPSGGDEFGVGDPKARGNVAGSFGYREGPWSAHLHVGHLMGQQRSVGDQLLGDTAYGGLLLQTRHQLGAGDLQWSLEALLSTVVAGVEAGADPRRTSLEFLGGARYFLGAAYFDLGGGWGAVDAGVVPSWRLLASVGVHGLWETAPAPAKAEREIVYLAPPPQPAPAAQQAAQPAPSQQDIREHYRIFIVEEQSIFFEVGKADLDDRARGVLRVVALSLLNHDRPLLITGYADDRGSPEHNEELSLRRAQAVRDVLVEAGIAAQRLELEAAGDAAPIAPSTEFGRSINRRVTFSWR